MSHTSTETNNDSAGVRIQDYGVKASFVCEVDKKSGQKTARCYQCGECTAGCPAAFAMEVSPNQIMRMVQIGCEEPVLKGSTIWMCAGCETCASRCPRGLSVAKVMDACREIAAEKGIKNGGGNVATFHEVFLADVARNGRVHEVGMLGIYKMKSRDFFTDIPLGIKMFFKGKLVMIPSRIKGLGEVRNIFRNMAAKRK